MAPDASTSPLGHTPGSCGCIAVVDAKLAERNTRIMQPIILRMAGEDARAPRPMIVTEQIETGRGKKKAVGMFATFCPFCGIKIGEQA